MAASEEVEFHLLEIKLKSTRGITDQSLECKGSKIGEELDKNDPATDLIDAGAIEDIPEKDPSRSTNFTKFWKKKNEKKEDKNVLPCSWEETVEGRQIVEHDRFSSTGNSPKAESRCQVTSKETTFSDRKLGIKKNMELASSLMNDFRDMALDYSGALQIRYS